MHKLKQWYQDLNLQSRFTLVLLLIVSIPAIAIIFFFYGRAYDMVVSYTIRQEQDRSAETAPLIEESIQKVLDVFNLSGHFDNFTSNIFDIKGIVYFLSVIAVCLFLTTQSILKRRWN